MQTRSLIRCRLLVRLLVAVLWSFLLPDPAGAQATNWVQWMASSSTSATFTIPGGPTGTVTLVTTSCANNTGFNGLVSLGHGARPNYPATWYTPTPPDPAQFLSIAGGGNCAGNAVVGTLTITFDAPVTDPVLHFINLDASEYRFLDGVSLTRLSGNNQFEVVGANVNSPPTIASQQGCEFNGTAPTGGCGSVRVNGTFTTLRADVTDIDASFSGDGHFFTISTLPNVAEVTCAMADPNIFNTGYDGAGGRLAAGSDPYWQFAFVAGPVSGLPSGLVYSPAVVVTATHPLTAWGGQKYPNAAWISRLPGAQDAPVSPTRDYFFRYHLNLAGVDPAVFRLALRNFVDNNAIEAYVNGVPQGFVENGLSWVTETTGNTLTGPWQSGLNEIVIQVRSTGDVVGLVAQLTPAPLCAPATVTLTKTTQAGAGGPFGFSLTNTTQATGTVTTATPGAATPVDGDPAAGLQPFTVSTFGADITISETSLPPDWSLASVSCTSNGVPVGALSGGVYTIPGSLVDASGENFVCSFVNTPLPADLAITKTSTPNPFRAGEAFTYTIVASNLGPRAVSGAMVTDTFPPELAGFTWSCAPAAACGATSGTGSINVPVTLAAGASATFTVTGTLPPGTGGPLINTATIAPPPGVDDPVPGNNTVTDVNPGGPKADLRISKASTPNPYVPGEPLTYTIVVSNAGPADALGARVLDPLPPAFASFTWTCTAGPGAACVTASGTGPIDALVNLPAGTSATFTSTGTVPSGHAGAATNTAVIVPPPNVPDPVPGNNTWTSQNPPGPVADLSITKTQTPDPYVPGQPLTYTLLVRNLGPSDAANARVQDVIPSELANVAWTCQASAGGSCGPPNGSHVVDAFVTLPAGASATFTITADVPASLTGVLINTATVAPPPGVTDPVPGNNESTVTSGAAPQANLSIVKTASSNPYVPGTALSFTIVVSNPGTSDVFDARVQDLFPAPFSGFTWTCAPSAGGATCETASGVSIIDALVNLPVGSAVTFTVTGTVPTDATGPITNTATVAPPPEVRDPDPSDNTSSVTVGPGPQANLRVTKTSTPNPYASGSPLTYTVVLENDGPSALVDGRVRDEVPAALQNVMWSCSAINGTCPAASGAGSIDGLVDIEVGGSVTFTITGDVPPDSRGVLINSATLVPPPGVIDPDPRNNTGINYNPAVPPGGPADLQITQEFPSVAPPNGLITFRLRSRNLGGNTALNPYMTGLIPPGTTFVSVTPSEGGTCNTPGNPPAPDPVTGYPIPGAATEPLKCTWPGLMKPGESHYMEFTVRVAPGTPTGQILWSCWWTWSETDDPYHANNVVDAYLFVDDGTSPVGDLQIQAGALSEGTIDTSLAAQVGSPVPMRFWVTNHGPAAARGQYALILDTANTIQIVDVQLPQGWVSPSGPSSAVWDTGAVQPGQTVALDLTVKVLTPGAMELFAQRITGSPGDPNAGNERATIVLDGYAPGFAGRWVAVGNVDGAGAGEIVTGAGQGETPQVRLFTGTGADTGLRFFAYERPFLGGVQIASCDVNGDGVDELITAPGPGRASTIRVLSLAGGVVTELMAFDAFEAGFVGGASVACADLDADGSAEVVVGAGPGRAPEVQVYNVGLSSVTPRASFLAYEAGFLGGVRVAAGVYPGKPGWVDAFAIATTPGPGRAAELRLFTPTGGAIAQVVVSTATKGVLPTLGDVNGDGQLDLLLAPDDGRPELVRIFEVDSGMLLGDVPGGLAGFPVGIRTALGVLDGGPGQPEIVIGNGPGGHPRVRVIYWPPAGPVQRLEILPLEIP